VDVLAPPRFEPSGVVKPVATAIADGDWLGVANVWLFRPDGELLYQVRPPEGWEANKLDGSVGGYYRAGESGTDILREAQEELGWSCTPEQLIPVGRHLSVGVDARNRRRHLVVTTYMAPCSVELSKFTLCRQEVPAVVEIHPRDVLRLFADLHLRLDVSGRDCDGRAIARSVSADDFTYVFGGYHAKIANIAWALARGDAPPSFPF
jgi:8-oxo-dGTP pyrophosphatase MutT (NUDIX family)